MPPPWVDFQAPRPVLAGAAAAMQPLDTLATQTSSQHWSSCTKGGEERGGGSNGLFWRHARHAWLEGRVGGTQENRKALGDYQHAWITEYSWAAQKQALADTEQAFKDMLDREWTASGQGLGMEGRGAG